MAQTYETVSISFGTDPHLYRRYEFHVMAPLGDDRWETLAKGTGYKSKAQAKRAAIKAAEPFLKG